MTVARIREIDSRRGLQSIDRKGRDHVTAMYAPKTGPDEADSSSTGETEHCAPPLHPVLVDAANGTTGRHGASTGVSFCWPLACVVVEVDFPVLAGSDGSDALLAGYSRL